MTGWRVHGWVLMDNHYHLMLETPEPNLVAGMKWLQNTYTRRFNTRHKLWGSLFGDRYKAVNVEGRAGEFYGTLLDYLHLNPVRAGIIAPRRDESVRDYPWSSVAGGYALPARQRAGWLAAADGLAAFGLADDTRGRRAFVERLDRRAREEAQERCGVPAPPAEAWRSHLRHGWYWGSQAFAEKLLQLAEKALPRASNRTYRGGLVQKSHSEGRAIEIIRAGLAAVGLAEKDLASLPGSDPRKVALAQQVWAESTVTMSWIATKLQMRSAANVSQILRREKHRAPAAKPRRVR